LDIGVSECFSVPKYYPFPFPTLPNQETTPASTSPDRTISLEEKAGISRLAKDACFSTNQGSAKIVRPKRIILRYFAPRQSRLDRFQQLRRFRRLVSAFAYGFEDFRFFRKVDRCMWMFRVLDRHRNERVVRVDIFYKRKADKVQPVNLDKSDGSVPGGSIFWREEMIKRELKSFFSTERGPYP
jgi:hypothetical protein